MDRCYGNEDNNTYVALLYKIQRQLQLQLQYQRQLQAQIQAQAQLQAQNQATSNTDTASIGDIDLL